MAGFGRFKLTDALPQQPASDELASSGGGQAGTPSAGMRKSRGKGRGKSSGRKGKPSAASELAAEQIREAREVNQAKNAEASTRDRMVDIGRGNQQAGRQRASRPNQRIPRPRRGAGSGGERGGRLRGGPRHRRGDRAGVRGRGCPGHGRRSRPERPRSGQPAVRRRWAWWPT